MSNIFIERATKYQTPARWVNTKTGKERSGWYTYQWAAERFIVKIDGLASKMIQGGDVAEYGNWKKIRNVT